MELKLVLEGSRVQKEVEISTEESSVEKALTNGADEDAVQNSHRSGRKSHRGLVFFSSFSPPSPSGKGFSGRRGIHEKNNCIDAFKKFEDYIHLVTKSTREKKKIAQYIYIFFFYTRGCYVISLLIILSFL